MIVLPSAGQKCQTMIEVEGEGRLDIPATLIGGLVEGPTVLVAAGVHGGEYAGILALIEVAGELGPAEVRGRLILLHPVNVQGFQERRATVLPADGRNINSLFPGEGQSGPAAAVARAVAELQTVSDFYLDLHTADLFEVTSPLVCCPATGEAAVIRASRRAALWVEAPWLIESSLAGAGITCAARRGVPALLIKRGGQGGACRRPEVDFYKKDVLNVLKHLGLLAGPPEPPSRPPRKVTPTYLRAPIQGLWQAAVEPGREVKAGQALGRLSDFFGRTRAAFTAEKDGQAIYGLAALSANPGDILLVY